MRAAGGRSDRMGRREASGYPDVVLTPDVLPAPWWPRLPARQHAVHRLPPLRSGPGGGSQSPGSSPREDEGKSVNNSLQSSLQA